MGPKIMGSSSSDASVASEASSSSPLPSLIIPSSPLSSEAEFKPRSMSNGSHHSSRTDAESSKTDVPKYSSKAFCALRFLSGISAAQSVLKSLAHISTIIDALARFGATGRLSLFFLLLPAGFLPLVGDAVLIPLFCFDAKISFSLKSGSESASGMFTVNVSVMRPAQGGPPSGAGMDANLPGGICIEPENDQTVRFCTHYVRMLRSFGK